MKKLMKKIFTLVLLVTVLTSCTPVNAKSRSPKSPTLTDTSLTMIPLEKYDINVNNKISNSTYKWTSSNSKVVKVNEKNGKIQALMIGKSTVTCTIKSGNRTYKLTSKVTVNEKPKFFTYDVMAHALGGLDGKYTYNNALEGLKQSLDNNYGFIEVDLILTKDNKLVCSHGWSEQTYLDTGVVMNEDNLVMTYDQFMNTKIQGKYTTVDVSTIVETMKENKDILFELDLRTLDKETATKTAKAIVKAFGTDRSITDRLLVQVGSEEMYKAINEVYNFKYYQYFVHKAELKDIDKVIETCKENGIVSIAIKEDYLTEKILSKFKDNGICVLIHTVDDVELAQKWLNKGVDTVCTNFILPNDVE